MIEERPKIRRTEPEWGTDFGPPASRVKRILWAVFCIVFVAAFLVAAVHFGQTLNPQPKQVEAGIPTWLLFIPFAVFLVVVAIYAERIALWIQKKVGWKPDVDEP